MSIAREESRLNGTFSELWNQVVVLRSELNFIAGFGHSSCGIHDRKLLRRFARKLRRKLAFFSRAAEAIRCDCPIRAKAHADDMELGNWLKSINEGRGGK